MPTDFAISKEGAGLLSWIELSASYGNQSIFGRINGGLYFNSVLTIVGSSGCGKTTLLLLLARLLEPLTGEVILHRSISPNRVVYLSQHDALLPWRSLRENIGLGMELQTGSVPHSSEIDKWAGVFNSSDFLDREVCELSGGMRKRICLARTFCANPSVVFLDEPFNNLDFADRRRVEAFLRKWVAEGRRGVICVTHDIDQAVAIGDRIGYFTGNRTCSNENVLQFKEISMPNSLSKCSPSDRRTHPEFFAFVDKLERLFDEG